MPIAEEIAGGAFSVSDEGTLVYRAGSSRGSQLAWVMRDGRHAGVVGAPAYLQQLVLSPSGTRAAVQRIDTDTGNADIWSWTWLPGSRRGSRSLPRSTPIPPGRPMSA